MKSTIEKTGGVNLVSIEGNLGGSPRIMKGEHGIYGSFSVCNNIAYTDTATGKLVHEQETWTNIKFDSKTAAIASNLNKGDLVEIVGRLTPYQSKKYKTDEGEGLTFLAIKANEIHVKYTKAMRQLTASDEDLDILKPVPAK